MKKILLYVLLVLFFFGFLNNSFATSGYGILDKENCGEEYIDKIQECVSKQDTHRTIEDYVCIQSNSLEYIVFQVVLDVEFKKIDEEIKAYLDSLEKAKDYYFGPNKKENYTTAIDEIVSSLGKGGYFEGEYSKLCKKTTLEGKTTGEGTIIGETMKCLGGKLTVINAKDYLGVGSICERMYTTKLIAYKNIAFNILKLNKQQVYKDSHKEVTQDQRRKYNNLLELIRLNIHYITELWKKWTSKTESVLK